jgi:hypothetical protein
LAVTVAAGVVVTGCGGPGGGSGALGGGRDAAPDTTFHVTDSAGVRLVTLSRILHLAAVDVSASGRPRWRTGWRDEEPSFGRIHLGYLLESGGAVVADGGKGLVYVIDSEGRVEARFGGSGDGPGEFRRIDALVHLPPDSILVADGLSRRASVFSPDGWLERTFPLPPFGDHGYMPDAVAAGRLLYLPYASFGSPDLFWRWVEKPVLTSDPLGTNLDTLAMPPREAPPWGGTRFPSGFPHHGVLGGYRGGWVWASNTDTPIEWHSADGALSQFFREVVGRYDGTMQIFARLVVGQDGSVWRAEDHGIGRPHTWLVVLADGTTARRVTVPAWFRVLDGTADRVLGVWQDELGVEAAAVLLVGREPPRDILGAVRSWIRP